MTATVLVRDLMKIGVFSCKLDTPVPQVVNLLLDNDIEGLVVLDGNGNAAGVVTRNELVDLYTSPDPLSSLTAQDIMRYDIPRIPPDIPVSAVGGLMRDCHTRIFFIMHHGGGVSYPSATISYKQLLENIVLLQSGESQL